MAPSPDQVMSVERKLKAQEIARTKYRLRCFIFGHFLLGIVMLLKLVPEILDMLDIFVLEIEELFLPKPLLWEWIWLASLGATLFGLNACRKSKVSQMRMFQALLVVTAILPIVIGMGHH